MRLPKDLLHSLIKKKEMLHILTIAVREITLTFIRNLKHSNIDIQQDCL